ncbi:transitional endoplasmic reticulum ATPase [Microbacteriaceae bacterium SG_E_30_P1]|uniref:Transitional endoplasmic reticulum ATPase n=1 Tax=Antiquaquibacter oligotrophicus TaxID=2880260 RepID=A0ABT6KPA6_9MICO|nr:ATP-binding protein [Antiquaquibacter oligotrophicus]MDH6181631.1 transitional endoplasmic reticulum ATPase [Antiquaquibacter oligotrophicus]UDF12684.1 ATP-binding protein [Antiquaquibacter oligotrophicus]
MSNYFNLARVHSVAIDADYVWVEFPNGSMAVLEASDLPSSEPGSFVHVSNDLSVVLAAPAGAAWPRQFRIIGTLRHTEGERSLLEIASQLKAVEAESIESPNVGESYWFDESARMWRPLTQAESNVVAGFDAEDSMPFAVESLKPEDGGAAAVGGLTERITELTRLVLASFDARATGSTASGLKPISGAMFFGPAGTGKTHLARSVAQETNAQLITVNGPELVSKWVGATERVLRDLFAHADKYPRSIIFFDEFDTIGARRSPESHDFVNRQVGQLLATMDGANRTKRPFVIASTNRLEDVDEAFLRPGRFDYTMEFTVPKQAERLDIIRAQSRSIAAATPAVIAWLASASNAWTPAELGLIWTEAEAGQRAAGAPSITKEHIALGYEKARAQHSAIERTRDAWALEEAQRA